MRVDAIAFMRRAWPTLLVYVSLGFVALWLARSGNLVIPELRAPGTLAVSLACLISGFVASAMAWQRLLAVSGFQVGLQVALASVGLTIFGKYIPGKVWALIGRAGYTAEFSGFPLGALSALSVTAQLIAIWLGLLFGGFVFLTAPELGRAQLGLLALTVCAWALLTTLLASDSVGLALQWLSGRLRMRLPQFPRQHCRRLLAALPPFALSWCAWMLGFSLFVSGLTGEPPVLAHGAAFALAATLGILAVVVPGGLGVREGLLVLLLSAFGIPVAAGAGIAIHGRIWFLVGEASIFLLGLMARQRATRVPRNS
jgi:uncharacterized membrane protein YbhN (UPF0104 family)